MMNADHRECRDLVARLSDGRLTTEDSRRLNELLKCDPIAQQMYLDHMFMDGLLEREFGGRIATSGAENSQVHELARNLPLVSSQPVNGPAKRENRTVRTLWVISSVAVCLLIGLLVFPGGHFLTTANSPRPVPLVLSDAGFESPAQNHKVLMPEEGWFGGSMDIVGQHSGVDPLEGQYMLHWGESKNPQSRLRAIYQLVDLEGAHQPDIEDSPSVFASANFNTAIDDDDGPDLFGVRIYAFSEKPVQVPGVEPSGWGSPLAIADRQLAADSDEDSWQNVSAQLHLPTDTRYLVLRLSVIDPDPTPEPDDAPADHFVDKVSLSVVSTD